MAKYAFILEQGAVANSSEIGREPFSILVKNYIYCMA
jgi:hypothetical protein